jgi:hypothetical protein
LDKLLKEMVISHFLLNSFNWSHHRVHENDNFKVVSSINRSSRVWVCDHFSSCNKWRRVILKIKEKVTKMIVQISPRKRGKESGEAWYDFHLPPIILFLSQLFSAFLWNFFETVVDKSLPPAPTNKCVLYWPRVMN